MIRLRRHECDIGVPDAQIMLDWHVGTDDKRRQSVATYSKKAHKAAVIDMTGDDGEVEEITSTLKQTYKRALPTGLYERRTSSIVTERFTPSSSKQKKHTIFHKDLTSRASTHKSYPYADICAGAGGTATAARKAGFNVVLAVDHEPDACATFRGNFPDADVREQDIFNFCTKASRTKHRVAVAHISFPCQIYSTAHTHPGKNDERNEAAGYSVMPLLQKLRPRIVTFEQSPNIARRYLPSFQALVHQLTELGFSVRWKVINFADTGNVQSRNRLFVIAACPGEPLPNFPKRTHGSGEGLKPFTTVATILSQVPDDIPPHMAATVEWNIERDVMPYNANRPLQGAITCDGGEANIHPNGQRAFNNQELAQLQGFPASHNFVGRKRSIMKQIGNAVPGKAATPFFKEIMKSLKDFDEEVEDFQNEVIELD